MMKGKIFLILAFFLLSFNLAGQNLSIKNRWNIKAGYSLYKTHNEGYAPFMEIPGVYGGHLQYLRRSNFRFEVNYGVLNWLEVGGYIGLMSYEVIKMKEFLASNFDGMTTTAVSPSFGINANIQLLPFFIKTQKCKWDFYIPVRYGGMYLTKWMDKKNEYGVSYAELNTWDCVKGGVPKTNNYRHEYGFGVGGAFYIKNIIGFYIEALSGQFSYCPELVRSPYAVRVGLCAKF